MESEITRDIDIRPSSKALWTGILAGPIAYAVDLQARYALVPIVCRGHSRWTLTLISVPCLLVALIGALLAWRGWSAGEDDLHLDRIPGRVKFMAISGLMLSLVFAMTIVASTVPDFFFSPCD